MRLLEEVHRLHQQGLAEAHRLRQLGQPRLTRDAVEDRIEIVQGVADLVEGERQRLVRRRLLEEEANGAARFAEIGVARMSLIAGREDGARRPRIEAGHQLRRPVLQSVAIGRRQKVAQHDEPVAVEGVEIDHGGRTRSMITGRSAGAPSSMRIA